MDGGKQRSGDPSEAGSGPAAPPAVALPSPRTPPFGAPQPPSAPPPSPAQPGTRMKLAAAVMSPRRAEDAEGPPGSRARLV